jgi:hypothetical protein
MLRRPFVKEAFSSSKRRSTARRAIPRCKFSPSFLLTLHQEHVALLRDLEIGFGEAGERDVNAIAVLARLDDVVRRAGLKARSKPMLDR